jgi:hypothetical protein
MGHQQCGEERLFVGIDPDGGNNANNLSLPSVDKAIGVTAIRYCGCTSGST